MSRTSEISLYIDTMIVETLLSDPSLVKTAQAQSAGAALISRVKSYFSNNIDENNKAGSILNLLAPAAISSVFSGIGLPGLGILIGITARVFHIDFYSIFSDVYNKIKGKITNNEKISSNEIDSVVDSSIKEQDQPATEEQIESAAPYLNKQTALRDAQMFKLAIIEYQNHLLNKEARGRSQHDSLMQLFSTRKTRNVSLIGTIIKWIFKIALASAGFMVAGDVINKFLGRPNAFDGTVQKGKPVASEQASVTAPRVIAKQTKFPLNPSYHEEQRNSSGDTWAENVPNTPAAIGGMVLAWAHQVYKGLDGQDSNIQSTAGFQTVVDTIINQNQASAGGPIVFIPRIFTSKKQIVDYFIDDVAGKAS